MLHELRRQLLAIGVVIAGLGVFSAAASASIVPSVSSTTAQPVQAGAFGNLDLNLSFAPTAGDSPENLTLELPPGLLSNVDVDNGGCLTTADINDATCQIGTGVITSSAGGVNLPLDVGFYLVPPPTANDLAGIAVAVAGGQQVGTVAPIDIRPSGDPDGVGANITFLLPNNVAGVPVSIDDIDATFDGLRFPTTCPTTPANINIAVNSYADPTVHTLTAPLAVTGCSALTYNPQYSLAVNKASSSSKSVSVTTTITQAATEAPGSSVSLNFGLKQFQPALTGLTGLCSAGVASGKCTPVGSVTATSPLYPTPLTGQAYLTGTLEGLTITLVFPAPFPLTLVGSVDLNNNVTTFTGLPDIPLTNLTVALNGGSGALFGTNCASSSGSSIATLTAQSGQVVKDTGNFTISGCSASSSSSGSSSGSGSSGTGSHSSKAGTGVPKITSSSLAGLKKGKPVLRFKAAAGANGSNLKTLTVTLPKGLRLAHKSGKISGVVVSGGKLKSAKASGGKLVVTLKSAVKRVTVKLETKALKESAGLVKKAKAGKKKLKSLSLRVVTKNANGKATTLHVSVKKLGL